MVFSSDVEVMVVEPVESMLKKVQEISDNPLKAAEIQQKKLIAQAEYIKKMKENSKNQKEIEKYLRQKKDDERLETALLENLIVKIGSLLALGFGEAGSEIIATNMKKSGDVDALVPGQKIIGIFGFCDIRKFGDMTDILQIKIMVYVNEIAEIVHGVSDQYCGQTNKNIGEAFLMVWKYDKAYYIGEGSNLRVLKKPEIRHYSDLSVLAFCKTIICLHYSNNLKKYPNLPQVKKRLPNFKVNMGFGLHTGWAIEGAIGSSYKIDASYLSPNVNIASRLDGATKFFGVPFLFSGMLYEMLSPETQMQSRLLDVITVKGSIRPVELYTVDMNLANLETNGSKIDIFDKSQLTPAEINKKRVLQKIKRDTLRKSIFKNDMKFDYPYKQWIVDKDLKAVRQQYTKTFIDAWKKGFQYYVDGEWVHAKNMFQITKDMIPGVEDGPSKVLLNVIEQNNGKAPGDWKGYRTMTEK